MEGDNKVKRKQKNKIPTTVIESIPYMQVYENGMIEIESGKYSKSYKIPETNFKTSSQKEQWLLVQRYSEFIGMLDPSIGIEVTMYNHTVDADKFREEVLLKMQPDKLNKFREEYNEMLTEKMCGAKNNLETQKILTLTIEANGIDEAVERFSQIDGIVTENMTLMTKMDAEPLTLIERLEILNSIYNQNSIVPLYRKEIIEGNEVETFSLENCKKQGITTKDVIAPADIAFSGRCIEIGETIAQSYYISNYPTWVKGTLLTDFAQIPTNLLVSVHFNLIPQEKAIKLLKKQRTNINAKLEVIQKKSARDGIDSSMISPDLTEAQTEANNLMSEITKDNGHLFTTTFVITLFAENQAKLKGYEKQMQAIASKNMVTIKPLGTLKEFGFNTSLPLGNRQLDIQRLMTSDTICAMNPFNVKEVKQKGGLYYGLNAASRNMILYDRTTDLNPNAIILGMPGARKIILC